MTVTSFTPYAPALLWGAGSALAAIDLRLAGRAKANAAGAVEDGHQLRRLRRFEETEVLLTCGAAIEWCQPPK